VCVGNYEHFATPQASHFDVVFAKYEADCLKSVYQAGYIDTAKLRNRLYIYDLRSLQR
jgi:hypothetical protein